MCAWGRATKLATLVIHNATDIGSIIFDRALAKFLGYCFVNLTGAIVNKSAIKQHLIMLFLARSDTFKDC